MTSFTEIVAVDSAVRHLKAQQMVNMLHLRISIEKEPNHGPLDDLLDEEERKDCECIVFFQNWVGGNLDVIRDSYNGISNIDGRRLVAKAHGLQTLRNLGTYIHIIRSGNKWEEIMSSDKISVQHRRWICCQVEISLSVSGNMISLTTLTVQV